MKSGGIAPRGADDPAWVATGAGEMLRVRGVAPLLVSAPRPGDKGGRGGNGAGRGAGGGAADAKGEVLCPGSALVVEGLAVPVMSAIAAARRGISVSMDKSGTHVSLARGETFKAVEENRVYFLGGLPEPGHRARSCLSSQPVPPQTAAFILHKSLMHGVSHKRMHELMQANMLDTGLRIDDVTEFDCAGCSKASASGSVTELPLVESSGGVTEPLELVSVGMGGPITRKGAFDDQYYVIIRDVYSRYVRARAFREKADAVSAVIDMLEYLSSKSGRKIKQLADDNSPELINGLKSFCAQRKIAIVAYSGGKGDLHHDGTAGVANAVMIGMVRAALYQRQLPVCLWSLAMDYAAFTLCAMPAVIGGKWTTPAKVLFGANCKFETSMLKEFGSPLSTTWPDLGGEVTSRIVGVEGLHGKTRGWRVLVKSDVWQLRTTNDHLSGFRDSRRDTPITFHGLHESAAADLKYWEDFTTDYKQGWTQIMEALEKDLANAW